MSLEKLTTPEVLQEALRLNRSINRLNLAMAACNVALGVSSIVCLFTSRTKTEAQDAQRNR